MNVGSASGALRAYAAHQAHPNKPADGVETDQQTSVFVKPRAPKPAHALSAPSPSVEAHKGSHVDTLA